MISVCWYKQSLCHQFTEAEGKWSWIFEWQIRTEPHLDIKLFVPGSYLLNVLKFVFYFLQAHQREPEHLKNDIELSLVDGNLQRNKTKKINCWHSNIWVTDILSFVVVNLYFKRSKRAKHLNKNKDSQSLSLTHTSIYEVSQGLEPVPDDTQWRWGSPIDHTQRQTTHTHTDSHLCTL